jgi:hypothetical protein
MKVIHLVDTLYTPRTEASTVALYTMSSNSITYTV